MESEILTPPQKAILALVAEEAFLGSFYLSGGTALAAYHLRHRTSDDLDFFTPDAPDILFLHAFSERIKQALEATAVSFQRLYDRNLFQFSTPTGELKVEFTRYPFPQFEVPSVIKSVRVDSLRDIAANKLMAMLDRFDPKDFVDLFFILQKFSLEALRRDAEIKFGITIDSLFLGSELVKARRIAALPQMLKPLTPEQVKDFFLAEAKKLSSFIFE